MGSACDCDGSSVRALRGEPVVAEAAEIADADALAPLDG